MRIPESSRSSPSPQSSQHPCLGSGHSTPRRMPRPRIARNQHNPTPYNPPIASLWTYISGDTPSPAPIPTEITKPSPPNGLYEGGLVGAQVTAVWFVDLWEYAFNTGDTDDLMALCQDEDFCDHFVEDMRNYHENRIVTTPLELNIQPDGNRAFACHLRTSGISGLCMQLSMSQKSARFYATGPTNDTHEYTTVRAIESSEAQNESYFTIRILLTEQDDHSFIMRNIEWIDPEHT